MYDLSAFIGPEGYRHLGEIRHFVNLPHFKTTLVTAKDNKPIQNVHYTSVPLRKLVPDPLAEIFVRRPYGPVSYINFPGLESSLDGDVVNCVELYSFSSRQAIVAKERQRSKLVISSWETLSSNPLFHFPPYFFNVNEVMKRSDRFLVPTQLAFRCLVRLGIPQDRIFVVSPGIEIELFTAKRQEHEGFRILFVGRLDAEKGIQNLLQAFQRVYGESKEVELWLCGPTRSGRLLENYIHSLAKKYPIKLLGELRQEDLRFIYNQCDVFCLPSIDRWKWGVKVWEEQFGWTLLEAMSNGLPIIGTKCGAIPEVLGKNNIIIDQHSESSMVSAICSLIKNRQLTIDIGKANVKTVRDQYNLDKQRLKLDACLVEAIES